MTYFIQPRRGKMIVGSLVTSSGDCLWDDHLGRGRTTHPTLQVFHKAFRVIGISAYWSMGVKIGDSEALRASHPAETPHEHLSTRVCYKIITPNKLLCTRPGISSFPAGDNPHNPWRTRK